MVQNTIAAYREYRKRDEAIVELATRASDPEIQTLLVQVLNEHQAVSRAAQEDPANRDLVEKIRDNAVVASQQQQLLAISVPDANDLGFLIKTTLGKRQPKLIARYADEQWNDEGQRIPLGEAEEFEDISERDDDDDDFKVDDSMSDGGDGQDDDDLDNDLDADVEDVSDDTYDPLDDGDIEDDLMPVSEEDDDGQRVRQHPPATRDWHSKQPRGDAQRKPRSRSHQASQGTSGSRPGQGVYSP